MLTGISKKIELAANLAILVVSCLLAVVLVKAYFVNESGEEVTLTPSVASLDIAWNQNGQTLILALARNCRFVQRARLSINNFLKARATHIS
jgi:hypothetical protein